MTPREALLDRIDQLRALALEERPSGEDINRLIADVRVYFAGVGATHCPPARDPRVRSGTFEEARKVYG